MVCKKNEVAFEIRFKHAVLGLRISIFSFFKMCALRTRQYGFNQRQNVFDGPIVFWNQMRNPAFIGCCLIFRGIVTHKNSHDDFGMGRPDFFWLNRDY